MQFCGETLNINFNQAMLTDDKLTAMLLGSTGAFCQVCLLSKEEAHSAERIRQGSFPERTLLIL